MCYQISASYASFSLWCVCINYIWLRWLIPLVKLLKRGLKQSLYLKKNLFRSIYRGIKIYVKNILRIYMARFSEEIKNTEARRNFHHSYKKSVYAYFSKCVSKRTSNVAMSETSQFNGVILFRPDQSLFWL